MKIVDEEIFGPVLAVLTFDTEAEGIELANRSRYGLAAGVWAREVQEGRRAARRALALRPRGGHLDEGRAEGAPRGARDQGGHRVGEHVQLLRSGRALRRLQVLGIRARPGQRR